MSELRIAEQDGKGVELVIEIVKKKSHRKFQMVRD
jgi:hypothetical protein